MKLCLFHDQYKCCRYGSGSGGHPLRFAGSVSQNTKLNQKHKDSGRNRDNLFNLEMGHRAGMIIRSKVIARKVHSFSASFT